MIYIVDIVTIWSCFSESPCRMGSALDLDCPTRVCISDDQSSGDTQGCSKILIVQCSPREGGTRRGARPRLAHDLQQ